MGKWECTACGYIYDENVEEKKWDELPDEWTCPICGVVMIGSPIMA